jgi:tRNA(fMet)-specific endonuclease VapC
MDRVKRYMLDTNIVSHLLKGTPAVKERIVAVPIPALCISAVTAGELSFGLQKRPTATRLHQAAQELSQRLDVLPWDQAVAEIYGAIRATLTDTGITLAPLDQMIFAHAAAVGAVIVTDDRAFASATAAIKRLGAFAEFELEN